MPAKISTNEELIYLPIDFLPGTEIQVAVGKRVRKGDVIGEYAGKSIDYRVAELLKVKPKKVNKLLKKAVGDDVKPGEVLAEIKSWWQTRKVMSHVDGKVLKIENGQISLLLNNTEEKIISPFDGEVSQVEEEQVVLASQAEMVAAPRGRGRKRWGRMALVGERQGEVNLESVRGSYTDKIVVISKLTKGLWYKLSALGVAGVISNSASEEVWEAEPAEDQETDSKMTPPLLVMTEGETSESGFTTPVWEWFNQGVENIWLIDGGERKVGVIKE